MIEVVYQWDGGGGEGEGEKRRRGRGERRRVEGERVLGGDGEIGSGGIRCTHHYHIWWNPSLNPTI